MTNLNPCAQQKRKSQSTRPYGNIPYCLQLVFEDIICCVAFLLLLYILGLLWCFSSVTGT